MIRTFRQLTGPCWCGAKAGQWCVDREGKTVSTHNSRGVLSRKQVNIFLKASGLKSLPRAKRDRDV